MALAEYVGPDGAMGFVYGAFYNIIFETTDRGCTVRTDKGNIGVYSNEASARTYWRIVKYRDEQTAEKKDEQGGSRSRKRKR